MNHDDHNRVTITLFFILVALGDCNRCRVGSGYAGRSRHYSSCINSNVALSGGQTAEYGTKMETSTQWTAYMSF